MTHEPRFTNSVDTWDRRYSGPDFLFGPKPNVYLTSHASLISPGQRALCVADGEGRNSTWLAQQRMVVDAFDISPVGVAKADELARLLDVSVNLHVCSCDRWAWQADRYDMVAAIFVQFADPPARRRLFANIVSTLKPGGYLILQGYTPRQLDYRTGGPGLREHLYTSDLIRAELAALEMLELVEYDSELREGCGHAGWSALLGLVARKPAAAVGVVMA